MQKYFRAINRVQKLEGDEVLAAQLRKTIYQVPDFHPVLRSRHYKPTRRNFSQEPLLLFWLCVQRAGRVVAEAADELVGTFEAFGLIRS